jgi:dolichyl-phosphate-mannose--protein O-mannosyl transferase
VRDFGGPTARQGSVLLLLVVALAALVRLIAVNEPPRTVFDEAWYARDGCYYWRASVEACGMADAVAPDRDISTWLATFGELTPEHPPLGKWLIGAPMGLLGFVPGAWRLAAVAAGTATVLLLVLLARRAFDSIVIGAGVGLLLAIDFVHVVQSRLAMLDVFVVLMATAAIYFAVRDREHLVVRGNGEGHRGWMLAAGVAGGAATATKLAGFGVVLTIVGLVLAWEVAAWRAGARRWAALARSVLWVAFFLAVVPLVTYVLSYAGRLDGFLLEPPWVAGSWLGVWIDRQSYMFEFFASNPIRTATGTWLPMLEEGMPYVLEEAADGTRAILLFGNPVLWWAGFLVLVVALLRLGNGSGRLGAQVVVVAFATAAPGWLLPMLAGRPVHLYHAVPFAPAVCIAVGFLASLLRTPRSRSLTMTAVAAGSLVAFVAVAPILIARPLEPADWRTRACFAAAAWPQSARIQSACAGGSGTHARAATGDRPYR